MKKNRKSSTNPEINNYLAALEMAKQLHDKALNDKNHLIFSIPPKYTIGSFEKEREFFVMRESSTLNTLKKAISEVDTKAKGAKPPDEYADSKTQLIEGITLYDKGANYIKSGHEFYVVKQDYNAILDLFYNAEKTFNKGDKIFEEAYDRLP